MSLLVGGARLQALHTPGHTPGGTCWYSPNLGVVFTGDTRLKDGPGSVHVHSERMAGALRGAHWATLATGNQGRA